MSQEQRLKTQTKNLMYKHSPETELHPEHRRTSNLTSKINFLGRVYHYHLSKKLNTREEVELAGNQAEPENQAEPVPGPEHDQKKFSGVILT